MPVQNVRLTDVAASPRRESTGMTMMTTPTPRPAAVDAVRWAATLLTQLGLDPRTSKDQRPAA